EGRIEWGFPWRHCAALLVIRSPGKDCDKLPHATDKFSGTGLTDSSQIQIEADTNQVMDFRGYVDRIEFHFERLGVTARPSQQDYVNAWNNQIPAKKMAQTFARRQRGNSTVPTDGERAQVTPSEKPGSTEPPYPD